MELKKRVLKFTFEGKEFEVKFPTIANVKSYTEKIKNSKESELDNLIDLLDELGLPKSVCLEMEADHLALIFSALTEKKS